MKPHELVEKIKSKNDLIELLHALCDDLRVAPEDWENPTLERYLYALAGWLEDSDAVYRNQGREIPVNPSWRNIAEMLIAATVYE